MAIQRDGRVIIAGAFVGYNGFVINRVARIHTGDTDVDGIEDAADVFPLDPAESFDTDLDGIGNNADLDDDGDSVPDYIDANSLDATVNNERTLLINNGYKGSTVKDSTGVQ